MNSSIFFNVIRINSKTILFFTAIVMVALIIRMYYFPYGIPITIDGLFYFKYAVDVSILGHLPNTELVNNGWPAFLSFFFSIINSDNFLDYMTAQRLISVLASSLTSIPVYFLCRKYFDSKFALFGVILFQFDPRIIQNSLVGITEPFFVLFTTTCLALFLSNNKKMIYVSFVVAAIATMIRYEAVVVLLAISILYFIKFRRDYKKILQYGILIGIFILVLTPMILYRMDATTEERITERVLSGGNVFTKEATSYNNSTYSPIFYVINGLAELTKFLGWSMIPVFILFAPLGIVFMFKNKISEKNSILIPIIILMIPAFYAYSRGIEELRYLFMLYPLFCVISLFTIKQFFIKLKKRNLILVLLAIGIIFASVVFLEWKKIDNVHELEAYEISKKVVEITSRINVYFPESKYIRVASMHNQTLLEISEHNPYSFDSSHVARDYNTLAEFIAKEKLSHLVVDGSTHRVSFLNDVFYHEDKFPFLIKEYDSKDHGYSYHVKIFRIDYDMLNNNN